MIKRKPYGGSSDSEREVREKLQSLLPATKIEYDERPPTEGFVVQLASKYTEQERRYEDIDREKQTPADYFIYYKGKKIAVIEVTRGVPGFTIRNSRLMKISENKVEPLERENVQGYIVMVVTAENPNSEERFVWTTPEIIRQCDRGDKKEYVGVKWKQWLWVYRVPINKWNIGIESLVDELSKIQTRSTTIQTPLLE